MRKTELKINLSNLKHNINLIKKFTDADIQAVVKANSYGLNMSKVLETIEDDVESFSVITLTEAEEVRKLTTKPILLLQGVHQLDDYELIENHKLDFVIHSSWQLDEIEKYNLSNSRTEIEFSLGKLIINIDKKNSIHMKGPVSNIKEIKINL